LNDDLSTQGEKTMAMKLVKKTAEYTIYKRGDERYAVEDAGKNPVNGDEKVRILVAEELLKVSLPAEPAAEEPAEEEAPAEEAAAEEPVAEEAAAEEPAVEEATAEEAPSAEEAPAEEAAAEEPAAEEAEKEDK
jgi:hypothetical protein